MLGDSDPIRPAVVPRFDRDGQLLAWMADALCAASTTPHAWHGEDPALTEYAIATCKQCPVQDPCLRYALATADPAGIWGGLTARQRRAMSHRLH